MSPGRKPSRSPASTAGRVRMMRPTSFSARAATARAIEVGLAGPGRPDRERDRVAANRVHVALLVHRLRRDLLAAVPPDHVLEDVPDVLRFVERGADGVDGPGADVVAALDELDELVDNPPRGGD